MVKKFKLSEDKTRWPKNRDVTLHGKKLNYNASLQIWYKREVVKLVNKMTKETEKQVKALFKRLPVKPITTDESVGSQARILMNQLTEKLEGYFNKQANDLATEMLERTLKVSNSDLTNSLKQLSGGLTIKTSIVPPELTDVVSASIAENVSLIKSIPQQYFKDVTGAVMRSITSGEGVYELLPQIEKYQQLTHRRAELLTLDQTRKAYTSINSIKLQKLGLTKFEWIHTGGGREQRESHKKISGKVFSYTNLESEQAALGVPERDRGLPGYPVNCRCTFSPVIELSEE